MSVAALLMLQLMAAPAAPRWHVVASNAQAEYAVDPASIVRGGTRVRVNVRLHVLHPPAGAPAFGVMRYLFDCRADTIRSEASDIYNAQGRFIGTIQTPANELRDVPIVRGSLNARVRANLCPRTR